jgi:cytochrome c
MGAGAVVRWARRDYGTTGRVRAAATLALSVLFVSLGTGGTAAAADAGADLAAKKMCMGCHRIDERRNGPSFRDIARRYAGQPDAVATLSRKVITGGRGAWGMVPMPANPQVSEAEARQIVQWILTHR